MNIYKDGKQIKDATVVYGIAGEPSLVRIKGDANDYDASAFTFEESKTVKKTKVGAKTVKKSGFLGRFKK